MLYVYLSGGQHRGKRCYEVARGEVKNDTKEDGDGQGRQGSTDDAQDKTSHTESLKKRNRYKLL